MNTGTQGAVPIRISATTQSTQPTTTAMTSGTTMTSTRTG